MSLYQFFDKYFITVTHFIANYKFEREIGFNLYILSTTDGNFTFTQEDFEKYLEIRNSPLYKALM